MKRSLLKQNSFSTVSKNMFKTSLLGFKNITETKSKELGRSEFFIQLTLLIEMTLLIG